MISRLGNGLVSRQGRRGGVREEDGPERRRSVRPSRSGLPSSPDRADPSPPSPIQTTTFAAGGVHENRVLGFSPAPPRGAGGCPPTTRVSFLGNERGGAGGPPPL